MENYQNKRIILLPCYLLVGYILLPFILFAQSKNFGKDSLLAEQYFKEAITWQEQEVSDSLLLKSKQAAQLFANLKIWDRWYESQYMTCIELLNTGNLAAIINHLNYNVEHVLPEVDNPIFHAKTNAWLGYTYLFLGNSDRSLEHYLLEAEILENAGNPEGEYGDFCNIGIMYTMNGDYDQALSYLEKAKIIYSEKKDISSLQNTYWNTGKAYKGKQYFPEAIEAFQKYLELGGAKDSFLLMMGEVYQDIGDLDKAMDYAQESLKEFNRRGRENGDVYILIGGIHAFNENYKEAKVYYEKALANSYNYSRRELGELYLKIGDVYFVSNLYTEALENYQKALSEFVLHFKADDILLNPDPETIDLTYGLWSMEALVGKGIAFQGLYEESANPEQLEFAISCFQSAFQCIDLLRYHQVEETSKTSLINHAYPVYELAIRSSLDLYNLKGEKKYLDQAFSFSQRTKGFLLASSLQNINAREAGGVPKKMIQEEEKLKHTTLELTQDILAWKNVEITPSIQVKLDTLESQRFEAKRKLQKLKEKLEENYSAYYQLKYENKVASIQNIQEEVLDQETALLDFFIGNNSLFILTLTQDVADLQEIKWTEELEDTINQFILQAGNADFMTDADANYQSFTQSAHFLYQNLIKQSLEKIDSDINRLVIIPDGILNKLPFGALLSKPANDGPANYSFQKLSYLLEDYTISYHYAPQLLLQKRKPFQNSEHLNLFAGFAPDFSKEAEVSLIRNCQQGKLTKLNYNGHEVQAISDQLGGVSFLNSDASVDMFKTRSKDYRILHLATHACMNETDPLNHKIFFADEEYLSAYELFNLPLNTEMVVLSACETGVGRIVRGEGVMSLARGFSYTGCPSVVMSLWSVSDKASSDIMIRFYENLHAEMPKDKSLSAAKLAYVQAQKSNRHHPFYWAAFVPIGDMVPIDFNTTTRSNWLWWIGGGVLIFIFFMLVKKMKA